MKLDQVMQLNGDEWEITEPELTEWIELCGLNPDDLDK